MKKPSIFVCSKGYLGSLFLMEYSARFSSIKFSQRNTQQGYNYTLGDKIEGDLWQAILAADYLLYCLPPSAPNYEQGFCELIDSLVQYNFKGQLIFISSTSIFGDQQGEVHEESETRPSASNGIILLRCENYLKSKLASWVIVRPGGIIGPSRHPANFFKNNLLSDPQAPLNLIHVKDLNAIIMMIVDSAINQQIIHAVQSTNLLKKDFYQMARKKAQASELELNWAGTKATKKIISIKLKQVLNYDFTYPTIEACLDHL